MSYTAVTSPTPLPGETPAHIIRAQLMFSVTAEGPVFVLTPGNEIEVPTGLCLIMVHLTKESDGALLSHPIDWFDADGNQPLPTPDMIDVRREHDRLCTLVDYNAGDIEMRFHFRISLIHQGQVFTSKDPTIINRKPFRPC